MQFTVTDAAKLYGKNRSTIHRHIEAGRLSCTFRGDGQRVIDLAELIRCYGEPSQLPAELQQDATPEEPPSQQALLQVMQAMHQELVALRREFAQLTETVEQQRLLPPPAAEPPPPPGPPEAPQERREPDPAREDDPHGFRALVQRLRNQGQDSE